MMTGLLVLRALRHEQCITCSTSWTAQVSRLFILFYVDCSLYLIFLNTNSLLLEGWMDQKLCICLMVGPLQLQFCNAGCQLLLQSSNTTFIWHQNCLSRTLCTPVPFHFPFLLVLHIITVFPVMGTYYSWWLHLSSYMEWRCDGWYAVNMHVAYCWSWYYLCRLPCWWWWWWVDGDDWWVDDADDEMMVALQLPASLAVCTLYADKVRFQRFSWVQSFIYFHNHEMICPSFYLLGVPLQYLDLNVCGDSFTDLFWIFFVMRLSWTYRSIVAWCWFCCPSFLFFCLGLCYMFLFLCSTLHVTNIQVNVLSGIRKVFLCTRTHALCSLERWMCCCSWPFFNNGRRVGEVSATEPELVSTW